MRLAGLLRPSRPEEFHPDSLTDPDLPPSRHSARTTARRRRLPSNISRRAIRQAEILASPAPDSRPRKCRGCLNRPARHRTMLRQGSSDLRAWCKSRCAAFGNACHFNPIVAQPQKQVARIFVESLVRTCGTVERPLQCLFARNDHHSAPMLQSVEFGKLPGSRSFSVTSQNKSGKLRERMRSFLGRTP